MSVHELLPRVWRLACGEWEIPRNPGDTDDDHKIVRSKAYWAKLYLNHPDTHWRGFVVSICAGPAEHLMQLLQLEDHRGGAFLSLGSARTNLFRKVGRAFQALLTDEDSPLRKIASFFRTEGRRACRSSHENGCGDGAVVVSARVAEPYHLF